jgi:hypothetical protein
LNISLLPNGRLAARSIHAYAQEQDDTEESRGTEGGSMNAQCELAVTSVQMGRMIARSTASRSAPEIDRPRDLVDRNFTSGGTWAAINGRPF